MIALEEDTTLQALMSFRIGSSVPKGDKYAKKIIAG
jgi:hypothetical protein